VVRWIVLGAVLLGLLVLGLAVRAVLVRLVRLRAAGLALLRRQAEAEAVRASALALQERIATLQGRAEVAQRSVAVIRARRSAD
jgi:hypothetical protein